MVTNTETVRWMRTVFRGMEMTCLGVGVGVEVQQYSRAGQEAMRSSRRKSSEAENWPHLAGSFSDCVALLLLG